ncbi:MAG: hypothetical protein SPG97_02145 [Bacilli bacterium]|nr:hypothetical protein [Bacilli bacterium]
MSKCFITKLPSSVDNDNLPVLGQLRINWLKNSNLTNNNNRAVNLGTTDSITVKVYGAHFTDSTLTNNLGDTKTITNGDGLVTVYVSNDADAVLTIDNKYSLTTLDFNNAKSVYFDIEDIKYCTNFIKLGLPNSSVTGYISAVSNLTKLVHMDLSGSSVTGDISALSKLTNITLIYLSNSKVSGDISVLSKLTKLYQLKISYTSIGGDISALSKLTNITILEMNETKVSGAVDSLAGLINCTGDMMLTGTALSGDMSKIPDKVRFITMSRRKISTNFTWTTNGRQNATLLAMEGSIPFDTASMDNMLIDQATCTVSPNATDSWQKIISVNGTRTSASDAAVTAIQNKGITIIGVTKQA